MQNLNILVTGGAGYIGSHMVDMLIKQGYKVIVLDNLSTGYKDSVVDAELIVGSVENRQLLEGIFSKYNFAAVMHFAGFIQVGESVKNPSKYYQNNLMASLVLLDVMQKYNVKNLIFSSTAAIYGEPQYIPIDISHPKNPCNPYGKSKWMFEQILSDYDKAYGLRSIALRYFNASGADPDARFGEKHNPETHLIPLLIQVVLAQRAAISIYGNDYSTPDGTCVRDYIHVIDLCKAHLLSLEELLNGATSTAYNLGNEQGYSVLEVVRVVEEVTRKKIKIEFAPRRVGDPAVLIADSSRAKQELGWQPEFPDLKKIVQHAWYFHKNKHI